MPLMPTASVIGIVGPQGPAGAGGGGIQYTFDTGTTDADPGTGKFRFNNADPTLADHMYINFLDFNGLDQHEWVQLWITAGNNITVYGNLVIRSLSDPTIVYFYWISIDVIAGVGYTKIGVAWVQAAGSLTTLPGDCVLTFTPVTGALDFAPIVNSSDPSNLLPFPLQAGLLWDDISGDAGVLKIRNKSDDGWLAPGYSAIQYTYDDSSITNSDPGAGNFRLNNADADSATAIYIAGIDFKGNDQLYAWSWASAGDVNFPVVIGYLEIVSLTDPDQQWRYNIVDLVIPIVDYIQFSIVTVESGHNSGTTFLTTPGDCLLRFIPSELGLAPIVSDGDPSGTYSALPNMRTGFLWCDTSGGEVVLKMRNKANNGWVTIGP